jgi:uncharacterized repeat protein (TIGR03806 family)
MRFLSRTVAVFGILCLQHEAPIFAQSYGLDTRSPIGAFLNQKMPPATTVPSGAWTVVNAFPSLTFQDPTCLVPEPGSNRLYVGSREGYIWFFNNDPNTTTKTLFLDLSAQTQGWDDCGLLGFAFHPQFGQAGSPNRGYVYVYYQYQVPGNIKGSATSRPPSDTQSYNRLSRFTVPDGSSVADPNSELVLINQFDRNLWHDGGGMFFGSDGFLYLSNGDEGNLNEVFGNAQRINFALFSGVLRIDVDQNPSRSHPIRRHTQNAVSPPTGWPATFSGNYYIPNDNPWLDPNGSVLEEFYAIGFRSPHRMTFDPPTGQIWLGDVGQDKGEEIDLIQKGGNYQWSYMEGTFTGPKSKPSPLIGTEKTPVYAYPHDQGDGCVIGGYVYRGIKFSADLGGKYIFGDNGSGRIWSLSYDGSNPPTVTYLVNMPPGMNYAGGLSSFGLDQNKELYMCTMGSSGKIYKLDRSGTSTATIPALLSQTGVFTNMSTMGTASGLIPYDVNMPLWSDGAVKRRWIAVPNDGTPYGASEQINFTPTGEWMFPQGTVFVKHFEIGTDDRNPSIKKRLETRLLVRDTSGAVYGVTYKWRADNSDADLLTGSLSENITIATATGTRTQTWYYPSRQDCLTCHTPNANYVLGVKTRQLNGDFNYPSTGRTDNQLRTWNHLGMFNPTLNESAIPGYSHLVNVTNTAASLEDRARSYIDANCAQCHRPNGVPAYFDARFDTPLASQGLVNGNVVNSMGIAGAKVVVPGDLSKSIMHLRMNAIDSTKMPPLAHNVVDTQALSVVDAWINSLGPNQGLPSPWQDQDIGNVGVTGDATYLSGTFTVDASGDDIWNDADAFHFVYQTMNGDGQIVARVASLENTDGWAKSGVMMRESLTANSRNVAMLMSVNQGATFQQRSTTGAATTNVSSFGPTVPYWVKLVRSGNLFTGYSSSDGNSWLQVASATITLANPVYVGLAVSAHNNTVLNTSTLDNVQVMIVPPVTNAPTITTQPQSQTVNTGSNITFTVQATGTAPLSYQWKFNGANIAGATNSSLSLLNVQTNNSGTYAVTISNAGGSVTSANAVLTVNPPVNVALPSPWQHQDVGSVGVAGDATYLNGTFTVKASGDDIWNSADAFHIVYQTMSGDGEIFARVASLQNTDPWAKSGVMMRESLTANSRNVSMLMTFGQGAAFQQRVTTGGVSTNFTSSGSTVPYWVRLVRNGNTFTGYVSSTGSNWLQVSSATISITTPIYIGLALSAHNNTVLNTSTLDNVRVTIVPPVTNAPAITMQPQSQTVNVGSNVTFTVGASGTGPLSYQWRFNSGNISGATNSSLSLLSVQTNNSGMYAVTVSNPGGAVTSSNATLTVIAPVNLVLPLPWQQQDLGSVGLIGGASYSNGVFSVQGSGDDIWNNADAFHFVYQPFNGDGQISARVISIQNTGGGWPKAGVMIRESLSAGSRHAFVLMSTGNGASFEWRTNASGVSTSIVVRGISAPYWVKLTRNGNVFTAYDSSDGNNWIQIGNVSVGLASNVYAGLAVTAHDNTVINNSTFDNVQVVQGGMAAVTLIVPQLSKSGVFSMILTGAPVHSYEIQGSTNLTNWAALRTLTNSSGQVQFTETNSTGLKYRFYRARFLQ